MAAASSSRGSDSKCDSEPRCTTAADSLSYRDVTMAVCVSFDNGTQFSGCDRIGDHAGVVLDRTKIDLNP
jgi:hypothetical protein